MPSVFSLLCQLFTSINWFDHGRLSHWVIESFVQMLERNAPRWIFLTFESTRMIVWSHELASLFTQVIASTNWLGVLLQLWNGVSWIKVIRRQPYSGTNNEGINCLRCGYSSLVVHVNSYNTLLTTRWPESPLRSSLYWPSLKYPVSRRSFWALRILTSSLSFISAALWYNVTVSPKKRWAVTTTQGRFIASMGNVTRMYPIRSLTPSPTTLSSAKTYFGVVDIPVKHENIRNFTLTYEKNGRRQKESFEVEKVTVIPLYPRSRVSPKKFCLRGGYSMQSGRRYPLRFCPWIRWIISLYSFSYVCQ